MFDRKQGRAPSSSLSWNTEKKQARSYNLASSVELLEVQASHDVLQPKALCHMTGPRLLTLKAMSLHKIGKSL